MMQRPDIRPLRPAHSVSIAINSRCLEAGRFPLTGAASAGILCSRELTHYRSAERGGRSMTQDRGPGGRKAARAPFPQRSRKRWSVAGGVVDVWLVLYLIAGSAISATMLLAAFAASGAIAVLFLRSMGVTRDRTWMRILAC